MSKFKSGVRSFRPYFNQQVVVMVAKADHYQYVSFFTDTNGERWEGKADVGMIVTMQYMSQWNMPEWIIVSRDRDFSEETKMNDQLRRIEFEINDMIAERSKRFERKSFEKRIEPLIRNIVYHMES